MEIQIPLSPPRDFNFESACSTPYISAPTSPQRFGNLYYSAPTSPASASAFYNEFNRSLITSSSVSFNWEEVPGTPKSSTSEIDNDHDFEFGFSGQFDRVSLSADELFDGGKIKSLKPPTGPINHYDLKWRSPKTPKEIIKGAFSPKQRKQNDPFAYAISKSHERGRERDPTSTSSRSKRRETRSVSPLRGVNDSEFNWDDQNQIKNKQNSIISSSNQPKSPSPSSSSKESSKPSSSTSYFKSYRKLKDFLLFRSASEGRGTSKDPLRKFSIISSSKLDVRNSSFRSTDSFSGSMRKKTGPVSAHELHYTVNRANSEEMKKKTSLPYKQGVFGFWRHGANSGR